MVNIRYSTQNKKANHMTSPKYLHYTQLLHYMLSESLCRFIYALFGFANCQMASPTRVAIPPTSAALPAHFILMGTLLALPTTAAPPLAIAFKASIAPPAPTAPYAPYLIA